MDLESLSAMVGAHSEQLVQMRHRIADLEAKAASLTQLFEDLVARMNAIEAKNPPGAMSA
jgi:phage shock protein A